MSAQPEATESLLSGGHTQLHRFHHNVKAYGATGDGVTDDTAAIQAAVDMGAVTVFFPPGTYKIADSGSITVATSTRLQGAGRTATTISAKNAYAFKTPATGALSGGELRDMNVVMRSGSTTGGAAKIVSNNFHSNWTLERLDCTSVSTCAEPAIWVDGWINSSILNCSVGGAAAEGILVASAGFVSNAWTIQRCRVASTQGSTTAALKVSGGELGRIRDCTFESNRGYGLHLLDSMWTIVEGSWFEDNSNHNILGAQAQGAQIVANQFHYNHGDVGTANHITLTQASAAQRDMVVIERNRFSDVPSSGNAINIAANCEDTRLRQNRGIGLRGSSGGGAIVNSSATTMFDGNDNDPAEYGGTGTPEGVIVAYIGSTYRRVDGGASTSFYVKESGVGTNTGWVAK